MMLFEKNNFDILTYSNVTLDEANYSKSNRLVYASCPTVQPFHKIS